MKVQVDNKKDPIQLPPELASLNIQPPWGDEYAYQRMVLAEKDECYPLLSIPGYGIYNSYKRHMLCIGTRKGSKSIAIANKCVRHAWEINGAIVAVVCRSIKNAKAGVWRDLQNFVLPGWKDACGLKIVKEGTDAVSKMEYIRIINSHGTISEFQLHSCDYSPKAEGQFKGTRFSMVWISEADQFEDRTLFDVISDQLRIIGIPYSQHQIICDCNWPEDGDTSYLWNIFEGAKDPESKYYRADYHEEFEVRVLELMENPFLDAREKNDLYQKYKHDPVKFKRFVSNPDREWIRDSSAGHFDNFYIHNAHCLGKVVGLDKSKWEVIVPPKDTRTVIIGIDGGDVNNAASFLFPWVNTNDDISYSIFDELCYVSEPVSIKRFFTEVWAKRNFWDDWIRKTYDIKQPLDWHYWADSSLWEYSSSANNNDAQIAWEASGKQMALRPVVKGKGSIRQRIAMTKRLFFDNRLFISANCTWNISWARFLKPGKAKNQPIADSSKPFNHAFCSSSYALGAEIPHELQQDDQPSVATGIITT